VRYAGWVDRWALARWGTGAALTRQFAILSLIVTAAITAALSLVISYDLQKDLLEREWGITADYVRTEAFYHLTPDDFAAPATRTARDHFEAFYRQTVTMPEIVRVKIYDANMTVVWSDEGRLIGQRFPDNGHLAGAIAGRTTVNIKTGARNGENIYERQEEFAHLVEVYVPITFPGTSAVSGVVETYKRPAQVFANIRKGRMTVLGTALAGGAFLYASLFWIVRRAGRHIDEQRETVEKRSRELAAANQQLREMQTQLLEAERMAAIGEVVTAVAHGIRNPLANIRASAQVAELDCRAARYGDAPRHLGNVMTEVDRLEGWLKELLQFVRPAERQWSAIDLNQVLRGATEMVGGRLSERGIRLEERLAAELPLILGDRMLLDQVFLSLVGNAVEAMSEHPGVLTLVTGTVQRGRAHAEVFAEIRDTGVGIPAAELPKIFEPFYTTKAQGTGLGLAIARKFAEAQGGAITVTSRPGEGACFRVSFPASPAA
jgi:two-component system sensor histidine kinase HydH